MKNERLKRLLGGFVAMAIIGLVGAPSAPVTAAVDDSTGVACAMYGDPYDEYEPLDSDGDGYPDDSDMCPYDPSNQCAGCSAAEHSVNVANGMAVARGVAAVASAGVAPLSVVFGIGSLVYAAGSLYIQHVQSPECF